MELAKKRAISDVQNSKGKLNNVILAALVSDLQRGPYEPLAVGVLAGALLEEIPDINVYISTVRQSDIQNFVKMCSLLDPTTIGLSIPQGTADIAKSILDKIHGKTNAAIVVGHAIPTRGNDLAQEYPDITPIKGWGENQLVNIVQKRLGREPIEDKGKSYVPVRVGEPNEYIRRIEASRGCNYGRCFFCTRPDDTHSPKWKPVDLDVIRKQLDELTEMGVTSFAFTDEDFAGNPKQIPELTNLLGQYNFKFSSAMCVETIIPIIQDKDKSVPTK
ncbi:MAG: radical SAM protein [Firmicutes bacterium]|nr:radical SAM protein [Bacillota bacterium]